MDISSADHIKILADDIQTNHSRIDFVVNNAGVQVEKTVTESLDQDWDDVMGINAKGVFMVCRALLFPYDLGRSTAVASLILVQFLVIYLTLPWPSITPPRRLSMD